MPIKDLKNWLPKPEQILKYKSLRYLTPYLADPRLWHFNRRSLSKAVYVGVMSSFFPLPGQMLLALLICLYFRANVPMAIGLTWITNPITTIPIYYFAYGVGALLLSEPMITLEIIGQIIAGTSTWIFSDGENPISLFKDSVSLFTFLLGLAILSILTSLLSGLAFSILWRTKTEALWRKRKGYRTKQELLEFKDKKK